MATSETKKDSALGNATGGRSALGIVFLSMKSLTGKQPAQQSLTNFFLRSTNLFRWKTAACYAEGIARH